MLNNQHHRNRVSKLLAVLTTTANWDTPLRFRNASGKVPEKAPTATREYSRGDPSGIRTRVTAVRGRRTRPLYDGAVVDGLIEYATEERTDKNDSLDKWGEKMRRTLLVFVSVVGFALMVSACSLLNPGPPRDSAGRITEVTTMSAQSLLNGDCFSFNSADGGVVEQVTVMPCSQDHDYLVIGQGNLTWRDVSAAGSLQNAVSVACATDFDAFRAAVKGDTRPKVEFLVFPETDEPSSDQLYSCVSTDPDQNFIPPTAEPSPAPES